MGDFAISSQAEYRDRFARTQREAGIAHLEWEGRLPPLQSALANKLSQFATGLFIGLLILAHVMGW